VSAATARLAGGDFRLELALTGALGELFRISKSYDLVCRAELTPLASRVMVEGRGRVGDGNLWIGVGAGMVERHTNRRTTCIGSSRVEETRDDRAAVALAPAIGTTMRVGPRLELEVAVRGVFAVFARESSIAELQSDPAEVTLTTGVGIRYR